MLIINLHIAPTLVSKSNNPTARPRPPPPPPCTAHRAPAVHPSTHPR